MNSSTDSRFQLKIHDKRKRPSLHRNPLVRQRNHGSALYIVVSRRPESYRPYLFFISLAFIEDMLLLPTRRCHHHCHHHHHHNHRHYYDNKGGINCVSYQAWLKQEYYRLEAGVETLRTTNRCIFPAAPLRWTNAANWTRSNAVLQTRRTNSFSTFYWSRNHKMLSPPGEEVLCFEPMPIPAPKPTSMPPPNTDRYQIKNTCTYQVKPGQIKLKLNLPKHSFPMIFIMVMYFWLQASVFAKQLDPGCSRILHSSESLKNRLPAGDIVKQLKGVFVVSLSYLIWSCLHVCASANCRDPKEIVSFIYGLIFGTLLSFHFSTYPEICPTAKSKPIEELALFFSLGFAIQQVIFNNLNSFYSYFELLSGLYFIYGVTRVLVRGTGAHHALCSVMLSATSAATPNSLILLSNSPRRPILCRIAKIWSILFIVYQKVYTGIYLMFGNTDPRAVHIMEPPKDGRTAEEGGADKKPSPEVLLLPWETLTEYIKAGKLIFGGGS
ncbi:unnamed protein product [Nesidiocoris tenuis]|uniref:Uncharacterized protein n=1 Tax=Nesidiocoris tenuis TaxID=355587 RepID=A0A6H5H779_9HEMI|nr:unnamed protein product [Nesidiocoris tenuis]